jgi:hypothetical protein
LSVCPACHVPAQAAVASTLGNSGWDDSGWGGSGWGACEPDPFSEIDMNKRSVLMDIVMATGCRHNPTQ